ncbi:MAG: hypothetical protein KGJ09_02325 [Candidatus Omnitrophica bacterium]|nr:hypothetical protein [Candidatus Omnitrophota bacterium]MDE2008894.1 hypothetical protein [Candidatus Omnitrophota bacterium]MDE2213543.1 hypothetical protein [Candidatus Omnitrophota bacterium]MDE2230556.1 hypothetical protein [Candidatus Omnitrophota bacterium]
MKKASCAIFMIFFFLTNAWGALPRWESRGDFYFLAKTRENFAAGGAGSNHLASRYLAYDGIDFLVKGPSDWADYGRLAIDNEKFFPVPIRHGMKIDRIDFLASGNYGNSYVHDHLLRLYGENYYYAVLTVTFVYLDGTYKILSAPVFWDWFHMPSMTWVQDGVKVRPVGINPVRPNCTLYHISFANPKPAQPLKDILVSDSWLEDLPHSDVFALTVQSPDAMPAVGWKD